MYVNPDGSPRPFPLSYYLLLVGINTVVFPLLVDRAPGCRAAANHTLPLRLGGLGVGVDVAGLDHHHDHLAGLEHRQRVVGAPSEASGRDAMMVR